MEEGLEVMPEVVAREDLIGVASRDLLLAEVEAMAVMCCGGATLLQGVATVIGACDFGVIAVDVRLETLRLDVEGFSAHCHTGSFTS